MSKIKPLSPEQRMTIYCDLMDEIKQRTAIIGEACTGKFPPFLAPRAVEEICYLQLRMICELIALAALLAHGDIEATNTRKIQRSYQADWIMDVLAKLHPAFYPQPVRFTKTGKATLEMYIIIGRGYLSRSDLKQLYNECGEKLHRGTVDKVLSSKPPPINFETIDAHVAKIGALLNVHQVQSIDPHVGYLIEMRAPGDPVAGVIIGDGPVPNGAPQPSGV